MKYVLLLVMFLTLKATAQKQDTIRVIMLVCDTSDQEENSVNGKNISVFWQFGYEARLVECCANGNTTNYLVYQPVNYYTHKEYLDENKKALSKNIIVWQSGNAPK